MDGQDQAPPQSGNDTLATAIGLRVVNSINNMAQVINTKFPNWSAVPVSSTSAGNAGNVAYDSTYFYVCVASSSWKRVALAAW